MTRRAGPHEQRHWDHITSRKMTPKPEPEPEPDGADHGATDGGSALERQISGATLGVGNERGRDLSDPE